VSEAVEEGGDYTSTASELNPQPHGIVNLGQVGTTSRGFGLELVNRTRVMSI
jgi:hypothetical protein